MRKKSEDKNAQTGKTILLVEDEAVIAMNEAALLEKHGYNVIPVYSGEAALRVVAEQTVDLVLMDIDLGPDKMDGTKTAQKILSEHEVPVVFLTSHSERKMVERVKGITRYGYVLKSAGEFVLLESITMAFELFEAHQRILESEERYRTAFYTSPDSININRMHDGLYVDINGGFTELTGFTREDVIGRTSADIDIWAVPEDREKLVARLQKDGFVDHLESVFRLKDGSLKRGVMAARIITIGEIPHILSITRSIEEQFRAEEKLKESEEQLKAIFEQAADGILIGRNDGVITDANRRIAELSGYSREELIGSNIAGLFVPEVLQDNPLRYDLVLDGKTVQRERELQTKDDRRLPIVMNTTRIADNCLQAIIRDDSERKKRDLEVQMLLKEQELLYRELNHRVKNNLLMISSLLNLKEAASGESIDLSDIKQQIEAIHLTHDELYHGKNISDIRIREYAEEILRRIFRSFTRLNVQIDSAMEDLYLPPQTALPIGLIINEVAVNAVKYGFSKDAPAVFSISFHQDQEKNECVLTLSNTGRPFPQDIDFEHSDTLGLSLLQALARQLGGTIELHKKPAAHYTIRFPSDRANRG